MRAATSTKSAIQDCSDARTMDMEMKVVDLGISRYECESEPDSALATAEPKGKFSIFA